MSHFDTLITRVHELDDLGKASAVLYWDREVNMPHAGIAERIAQQTTLSSLIHRMSTSDEMGELIERAATEIDGAAYDSREAALIRVLRRHYADARKLPADYVARSSQISGRAHEAWVKARAENDFDHFRPWLEQVVSLCQELAEYYGYEDDRYDPLLDKYDTNTKTAEVRAIFDALKADLIPLREAIDRSSVKIDDSILHQPYDIEKQKQFARYAATALATTSSAATWEPSSTRSPPASAATTPASPPAGIPTSSTHRSSARCTSAAMPCMSRVRPPNWPAHHWPAARRRASTSRSRA